MLAYIAQEVQNALVLGPVQIIDNQRRALTRIEVQERRDLRPKNAPR